MYYKNGEVAHKTSDQEATDFVRDVYAIGYYDGYYDGLYGYEEGTSYDIRAEY